MGAEPCLASWQVECLQVEPQPPKSSETEQEKLQKRHSNSDLFAGELSATPSGSNTNAAVAPLALKPFSTALLGTYSRSSAQALVSL